MAQAHVIPEATVPFVPHRTETIGVFGSGPVACAIAKMAARRGFGVHLVNPRPGAAEAAIESVSTSLDWLARGSGVRPAMPRRRLQGSTDSSDLAGVALVIEASGGDLESKLRVLRDLSAKIGPDTILATETTSFSVTRLAAATQCPERVVGVHFVHPSGGDLVEVVRALQTSEEAHDGARRFLTALGKTPVSTKDRPGFLVYRMLIPFINEACFALQEELGTVEDIDSAGKLGGDATGPLRMADSIGLDQCLLIAEQLHREFGEDKYRPAPLLKNYVAAGWLGRKTLRGFYTYPQGS